MNPSWLSKQSTTMTDAIADPSEPVKMKLDVRRTGRKYEAVVCAMAGTTYVKSTCVAIETGARFGVSELRKRAEGYQGPLMPRDCGMATLPPSSREPIRFDVYAPPCDRLSEDSTEVDEAEEEEEEGEEDEELEEDYSRVQVAPSLVFEAVGAVDAAPAHATEEGQDHIQAIADAVEMEVKTTAMDMEGGGDNASNKVEVECDVKNAEVDATNTEADVKFDIKKTESDSKKECELAVAYAKEETKAEIDVEDEMEVEADVQEEMKTETDVQEEMMWETDVHEMKIETDVKEVVKPKTNVQEEMMVATYVQKDMKMETVSQEEVNAEANANLVLEPAFEIEQDTKIEVEAAKEPKPLAKTTENEFEDEVLATVESLGKAETSSTLLETSPSDASTETMAAKAMAFVVATIAAIRMVIGLAFHGVTMTSRALMLCVPFLLTLVRGGFGCGMWCVRSSVVVLKKLSGCVCLCWTLVWGVLLWAKSKMTMTQVELYDGPIKVIGESGTASDRDGATESDSDTESDSEVEGETVTPIGTKTMTIKTMDTTKKDVTMKTLEIVEIDWAQFVQPSLLTPTLPADTALKSKYQSDGESKTLVHSMCESSCDCLKDAVSPWMPTSSLAPLVSLSPSVAELAALSASVCSSASVLAAPLLFNVSLSSDATDVEVEAVEIDIESEENATVSTAAASLVSAPVHDQDEADEEEGIAVAGDETVVSSTRGGRRSHRRRVPVSSLYLKYETLSESYRRTLDGAMAKRESVAAAAAAREQGKSRRWA